VIIQIVRDNESARPQIRGAFLTHITALCNEAKEINKTRSGDEEIVLTSPRLQLLQRLTNICVVLENMASEGRRQTNEFMEIFLSEEVIEGLIRAFSCTLPPAEQLFAQVSIRNTSVPHFYGNHSAAKAITGLLRVAVTLVPHSLLPALFRAVDETLGQISSNKLSLRAVSQSQQLQSESAPVLKSTNEGTPEELDLFSSGTSEHWGGKKGERRRSKSRGLSLGSSNVLILGVLDCIPNKCVFDLDLIEELKSTDGELQTCIWKFLSSILNMEWLSMMISYALLPMQKSQGQLLIAAGKDIFRRLFAFQRSSMLEGCRFASSKWSPKPLDHSRYKSGPNSAADFDSSEDTEVMHRIPQEYVLRVLYNTGALIREDCEIETSRGIFTASPGAVCIAYERGQTSTGLIRFRTAHGWLSENRRDQSRDPIVELLSLTPCSSLVGDNKTEVPLDPVKRKLMEAMTMRESSCYALSRVHSSLKMVLICLVKLCHVDSPSSRTGPTLSGSAPMLSGSLSKILHSFFSYPHNCLLAGENPHSLGIFNGDTVIEDDTDESSTLIPSTLEIETKKLWTPGKGKKESSPAGKKTKKSRPSDEMGRRNDLERKEAFCLTTSPPSGSKGGGKEGKKRNGKGGKNNEDEEDALKEAVSVDCAAACLYFGSVAKNILDPVLHEREKPGHLNTVIFIYLC
jgi:hypothetical protein